MSDSKSINLFTNDREVRFIRRPNRFLIIAGDGDEELPCHCPNPGRLIEFVFPGAQLILERRKADAKAKTDWTAAGIYYRNTVAPLFSARANKAAEKLILKKIIPGIREIQSEYVMGASRFDFRCIDSQGVSHLVEVKACSLIEYDAAMFPDAPSGRALKHLEELAGLSNEGYVCHILFVIVHGTPRVFIPNLHTDPAFAAGLSRYGHGPKNGQGPVAIHAALLHCDSQGKAVLVKASVPVDLSHGALAESDRGSYLVLLELPRAADIETGGLGTIHFKKGWYVYSGSAQKNLSRRVQRHLRKVRKQKHWHIDYLTPYTGIIKAFPIMSYRNLECDMAAALTGLGGAGIPGFGSSDCQCASHLYYFKDPPMRNRDFVDMLLRFRHRECFKR